MTSVLRIIIGVAAIAIIAELSGQPRDAPMDSFPPSVRKCKTRSSRKANPSTRKSIT